MGNGSNIVWGRQSFCAGSPEESSSDLVYVLQCRKGLDPGQASRLTYSEGEPELLHESEHVQLDL